MKKRRHIQTRVLVTLIGMTTAILLVVGLTFNLYLDRLFCCLEIGVLEFGLVAGEIFFELLFRVYFKHF